MYEVFDYRNGSPIATFRFELVARMFIYLYGRGGSNFLDYAYEGTGW